MLSLYQDNKKKQVIIDKIASNCYANTKKQIEILPVSSRAIPQETYMTKTQKEKIARKFQLQKP
jgi:hypothetical protein